MFFDEYDAKINNIFNLTDLFGERSDDKIDSFIKKN